jgi:Sec-independent protein translocase protein TatA
VFELSFEKLIVIGVIATFLIGPERLPKYAAQLARLIRVLRGMASEAKGRLEEELGPDVDVDWRRLDPRQYDPRRIIREALLEDGDDDRRKMRAEPEQDLEPGDFDPAEDATEEDEAAFDPDPDRTPVPLASGRGTPVDDEAT